MTKLVCVSDTHNQMSQIKVPEGDIFIHCGDWTMLGEQQEIMKFGNEIRKLKHKYKIIIPGNHDITFDPSHPKHHKDVLKWLNMDSDTILLINESATIAGIDFLGVSLISEIFNPYRVWGFESTFKKRYNFYNSITKSPTILISHSPPLHILDGNDYGCAALGNFVEQSKPKYHIFGHCHEGYGSMIKGDTTYLNVSTCNRQYLPKNKPIELEI